MMSGNETGRSVIRPTLMAIAVLDVVAAATVGLVTNVASSNGRVPPPVAWLQVGFRAWWDLGGVVLLSIALAILTIVSERLVTSAFYDDALATAVERQWSAAAMERKILVPAPVPIRWELVRSANLSGSPEAAINSRVFNPLPTHPQISEAKVSAGGGLEELFNVYAGLNSGRLVLLGRPGSGKTGAAILLLLDALRSRARIQDHDERRRTPVPVLLSAYGWAPGDGQSFQSWLVDRLGEEYRMFRRGKGRAAARELVLSGGVAVILDGLDQIPETAKALMLAALDPANIQADIRVILLSRTTEFEKAVREGHLQGGLVLQLLLLTPLMIVQY